MAKKKSKRKDETLNESASAAPETESAPAPDRDADGGSFVQASLQDLVRSAEAAFSALNEAEDAVDSAVEETEDALEGAVAAEARAEEAIAESETEDAVSAELLEAAEMAVSEDETTESEEPEVGRAEAADAGDSEAAESAMGNVAWSQAEMSFVEDAAADEASEEAPVDAELAESGEEAEAAEAAGDEDEGPKEFIEADQLVSIIESLLFSTDRPVSTATIKQMFKNSNIRTRDITRAIDMLASEYASPQRGVTLEEINGGYQLRTKADNAEFLSRLAKNRPFRLSGPALEVLAIVAYKQPIVKSEVDEIRGVESGHLLRALMERGLIGFEGKSELPGKPMQYGTTRKFLEIFGLRNLKELPTLSEIDDLIPEGIGGQDEEKETLSDITAKMSEEIKGTYSEGEDELLKITETLTSIDTSSEFFEQEKVRQREKRDADRAQSIREALVVGEAVDDKDRKWLERYEARLQAEAEAAARGETAPPSEEAVAAAGEEVPVSEAGALSAALEELSLGDESHDTGLNTEDDLDVDDLAAHPEWNDDEAFAADAEGEDLEG